MKEIKNYYPGQIVNYFLDLSGSTKKKTNYMNLQRILYLANGYWLANHNRQYEMIPLINEPFKAWEFGPVCESVYYYYRSKGDKPLSPKYHYMKEIRIIDSTDVVCEHLFIPKEDSEVRDFLDNIWHFYGSLSTQHLIMCINTNIDFAPTTSNPNPWKLTYERGKLEGIVRGKEIRSNVIQAFFRLAFEQDKL